jgi:cysteinyl-tRNA synthetase
LLAGVDIKLTNSLTRKKEKFEPMTKGHAGVYTCGPTVYSFVTIGNFRTYTTGDILVRVLKVNRYEVDYVMNITDVGHLTGDNLGDADIGEDRMEKAAKKEGKTAWDIAKYYTDAFFRDYKKLNLMPADNFPRATEHIGEQIELVKRIEKNGFTYKTTDGIYFDTKKYEKETGKKYGELSTMDEIKEGARVEKNPEKRNPRDFALWKFSTNPGERQMEWESPWGLGFPGWHIECSAMSMRYLGESFDIHVGGEDLRQTHHPNEIAQSEGATGKQFVKYWIHVTHLKVDGKRMGKSLGNFYTVSDLEEKGYDPLALRYLYLTAHYKDSLNFTWDSLGAAMGGLEKLRCQVDFLKKHTSRTVLSPEKREKVDKYSDIFFEAVNNDLNTPKALAVVWEMLKSNIPSEDKYDLLMSFDEVLGFELRSYKAPEVEIPENVKKLVRKRNELREKNMYDESDKLRKKIETKGFMLLDTPEGTIVKKKEN